MKVDYFFVGQDIQIQIDSELQNEIIKTDNVGDLFDELGDIVTANEINPYTSENWLAYEGNLYSFSATDFEMLKDKGFCRIYYIGSIEDNVDMSIERDKDFYNWYFNI